MNRYKEKVGEIDSEAFHAFKWESKKKKKKLENAVADEKEGSWWQIIISGMMFFFFFSLFYPTNKSEFSEL